MVEILGNNITDAYNNGLPVNSIYSYGKKVWKRNTIPGYYSMDYLQGNWSVENSNILVVEAPRIELTVPYISGGLTVEADVNVIYIPSTGNWFRIVDENVYYNGDWNKINALNVSNQGPGVYSIEDGFNCTSSQINLGLHIVKNIISDDIYYSQAFCDGVEIVSSTDIRSHYTLSDAENIKLVLFTSLLPMRGSNHHLRRLTIKDSNNNTLYDFVPVVRMQDDEPGLYDIVNNTFHYKCNPYYSGTTVSNFHYGYE